MAYRINYAWDKEPESERKLILPVWTIMGGLLVAVCLSVRLMFPNTVTVFRELLHPLTDENTISAFSELADQIGQGTPVDEALTVFCREILDHDE